MRLLLLCWFEPKAVVQQQPQCPRPTVLQLQAGSPCSWTLDSLKRGILLHSPPGYAPFQDGRRRRNGFSIRSLRRLACLEPRQLPGKP